MPRSLEEYRYAYYKYITDKDPGVPFPETFVLYQRKPINSPYWDEQRAKAENILSNIKIPT